MNDEFGPFVRGIAETAATYRGAADMTPSLACVELVKRFEGCRLHAYPDPGTGGKPWTIGFGATGPDIGPDTSWTAEQAEKRLQRDLGTFATGVSHLVGTAATTQHQFDALVSFAFNVGLANLRTSTLLKLHRAGMNDAAANQFQRWTKAAGRTLPGLVTRRSAEAELYRTPDP